MRALNAQPTVFEAALIVYVTVVTGWAKQESNMIRIMGLAFASSLLAVSGAAFAIADGENRLPPSRAPSLMTPTEIRAYNQGLDFTHPYYIRCKKDPVVGSLVRKLRVCRTNEDWKKFGAQGENNGRDVLDEMSHAPVNQGAPDACNISRC